MLVKLLYKWFGLDYSVPCDTCEVLRERLAQSDAERRDLLSRLLDRDKPEPSPVEKEELKPVQHQFVPWRVRQQMLEAEDRKKAELMRKKSEEIDKLEEELGVKEGQ